MLRFLLFCAILSFTSALLGQHERANWFFGYRQKASISFSKGNSPINKKGNPNDIFLYPWGSSISDRNTGELLFYTDGYYVINKNHVKMDGGDGITDVAYRSSLYPVIIAPYPENDFKYYIFVKNGWTGKIEVTIVDMTMNNGLGKVISTDNISSNKSGGMAVVSTKCKNGFWLVNSVRNKENQVDSFICYEVNASGINKTQIISEVNSLINNRSNAVWIEPNKTGDIFFCGGGSGVDGQNPYIVSFDQQTGKFSNKLQLSTVGIWEYSENAEFSADGSKLYVSYSDTTYKGGIIQFSGQDFSVATLVTQSTENTFQDLLRGPDDKIYILSRNIQGSYINSDIDAIEYPNNNVPKCNLKNGVLTFPPDIGLTNAFPIFHNITLPNIITETDHNIEIQDVCILDTFKLKLSDSLSVDSVFFDFGDQNTTNDTTTKYSFKHRYLDTGDKIIVAHWYKCGKKHTVNKKIHILPPPTINLGSDTVFCFKGSILLKPTSNGQFIVWNTGETTPTINIDKGGIYWAKTSVGSCTANDSIEIKELPPILVELGGEYTICDDGTELVTLDAGKGYKHYLWTPTGDTGQWIIVKKAGDYFVIVEDYHGCKGDDGAKVLRKCDFTFYMPNSFTPNGDGRNDVFAPSFTDITDYKIEIYNLWGEQIFETTDPAHGWDGMYKGQTAPIGAYIWKLSFKGFHNKLLRNYNYNGVVNLVR